MDDIGKTRSGGWKFKKPDGSVRLPGIPAVIDRVIQEAAQFPSPVFEVLFPDRSHGIQAERNVDDAVKKAKVYCNAALGHVADHVCQEKFFSLVIY
jgi:hypothetical protein